MKQKGMRALLAILLAATMVLGLGMAASAKTLPLLEETQQTEGEGGGEGTGGDVDDQNANQPTGDDQQQDEGNAEGGAIDGAVMSLDLSRAGTINHDLAAGPLVIGADDAGTYVVTGTFAPSGTDAMVQVGTGFTGNITIENVTEAAASYPLFAADGGFAGGLTLSNVNFTGVGANGVMFADGAGGAVTLSNCSINVADSATPPVGSGSNKYPGPTHKYAAFTVNGSGVAENVSSNMEVTLADGTNNVLTSGYDRAGLEILAGAQVTITGGGALTARCGEDASVYGSSSAGIGAGYKDENGNWLLGGNIIVKSGTIDAKSGYHGAGIGGGWGTYGGHVLIYGGTVTSEGGNHGSGIGAGCGGATAGSTLLVLPTATVNASTLGASRPLVGGMGTTIYIGDPNAFAVQVSTEENTPDAEIFVDVSAISAITGLLSTLGVPATEVDPASIPVGKTGPDGIATVHMQTNDPVRFFTTALSSQGLPFESGESIVVDGPQTVILVPYTPEGYVPPKAEEHREEPRAAAPQTGDGSNAAAWSLMALCAVSVMVLAGGKLGRRRGQSHS